MKNQKSKVNKHIASSSSMARKPNKSSRYIPEFFKVLDDVHFSRHLSIPPGYINHIDGFPSTCVLRVPTGKLWTVRVEERNDGCFFHGGWRQFVRDNTLQIGHFLLFAYDGDSMFDVNIYDHNGCEKEEYQAPIEVDSENSEERSEEDELDHSEDSNYEDSRVDEDREDEQSEEDELAHTDEDSEEAPISIKRERDSIPSGRRPATDDGKETCTKRIVFKSEHPCFVPTSMKNKYRVGIPKEIAILGGLNGQMSVTLKDPKGRSWTVQLRKHDRFLLTAGWVQCCRANEISLGDTVILEIVEKRTMKLHIIRGEAGGKRCPVVLDCPKPNHPY